jgi:hypothetical protein
MGNPITLAILDNHGTRALVVLIGASLCTGLVSAVALSRICLDRTYTWLNRVEQSVRCCSMQLSMFARRPPAVFGWTWGEHNILGG